ncbi:hypothetical protein BG011_001753 [Mortierella polycephala]|uniref:DSBA-like thioredoxin domain-containing protein n=1 Tax=Mortierella polycephala TaxID=41804 RepID=A0A9P6Q939_9FUNG|nr:hypothetical protein BG011_001753 [Mortierella polycephala]
MTATAPAESEGVIKVQGQNTTAPPSSPVSTATTAITTTIRLDIYSDTVCPWCYITKKRLEKAMRIFQKEYSTTSLDSESNRAVYFDIHWHPFQLDPQASAVPFLRSKLLARKFASDQAIFVKDRITTAGRVEGIQIRYSEHHLYCNSMESHRLIWYARRRMLRTMRSINSNDKDVQQEDQGEYEEEVDEFGNRMEDAMAEELFKSHFERGECGDIQTLKECARRVLRQEFLSSSRTETMAPPTSSTSSSAIGLGITALHLDKDEIEDEVAKIERFLESDEGLDAIKEEIRVAKQELQLQGVPAIVVQNTYLLSGGQDPATFVEVFKRVV